MNLGATVEKIFQIGIELFILVIILPIGLYAVNAMMLDMFGVVLLPEVVISLIGVLEVIQFVFYAYHKLTN